MRRLVIPFLLLASPALAQVSEPLAQCVDVPIGAAGVNGLSAVDLTAPRTFTWNNSNTASYKLAMIQIRLTDADVSITSLGMTCTTSTDANVTALVPQSCSSGSTCASTDSGSWTKASPGTKNWPWRLDVNGMPDGSCTLSVLAGSATGADLVTVKLRFCSK